MAPVYLGEANSLHSHSVITTQNGNIYVFCHSSTDSVLRIWKSTDSGVSFTSLTGVTDATIVGTGYSVYSVVAALDSNGYIHVVAQTNTSSATRDVAYCLFNTISDSWGTWEEVAPIQRSSIYASGECAIAIDSSNKPHVLYSDVVASMGTNYYQIYYSNKTGASWSTPEKVSTAATSNYYSPSIVVRNSDVVEAFYGHGTDTTSYADRRTCTSGTWGSETVWTNASYELDTRSMVSTTSGTVYAYSSSESTPYYLYENDTQIIDIAIAAKPVASAIYSSKRYIFFLDRTNSYLWYSSNSGSGWSNPSLLVTTTIATVVPEWSYNYEYQTHRINYVYHTGTSVYFNYLTVNNYPTVALNTPTEGQSISDSTPDLVFTGTDTEGSSLEYIVEVDTNSAFNGSTQNVDSFTSGSNVLYINPSYDSSNYPHGQGQAISFDRDAVLDSAKFRMRRYGSPTGQLYAKIYSLTGVYGTSAVPSSGSALYTSGSINPLDIPQAETEITFTFSSGSLPKGYYGLAVMVGDHTYTVSDYLVIYGNNSGGHSGNNFYYDGDAAWKLGTPDTCFKMVVDGPLIKHRSAYDTSYFSGSHPYTSGSAVTYTSGSLTSGSYYWHVRASDDSELSWGNWATARSFILTSGSGSSVSVTPTAVASAASKVDPTLVLGSLSVGPSPVEAIPALLQPTTVLGSLLLTSSPAESASALLVPDVVLGALSIEPQASSSVSAIGDHQIVQSSLVLSPDLVSSSSSTVNPDTVLGSISLDSLVVSGASGTISPTVQIVGQLRGAVSWVRISIPSVVVSGGVTVEPGPASAATSQVSPEVVLGSLAIETSATQAVAVSLNPDVDLGSLSITPAVAASSAATLLDTVQLGSLTLVPAVLEAVASKLEPQVVLGSLTLSPLSEAVASVVNPDIAQSSLVLIPDPVAISTATVDPSVFYGSLLLVTAAAQASSVTTLSVEQSSLALSPEPAQAGCQLVYPTVQIGSLLLSVPETSCASSVLIGAIVLGSLELAPAVASTPSTVVFPDVVFGSLTFDNLLSSASTSVVNPTVEITSGNISLEPAPASSTTALGDIQVHLGALVLSSAPAESVALSLNPDVILGLLSISPSAISCPATTLVDSPILGPLSLQPEVCSASLVSLDPAVHQGSLLFSPIVSCAVSIVAPEIVFSSTTVDNPIAQALATGIDPSVGTGNVVITDLSAETACAVVSPDLVFGSLVLDLSPVSSSTSSLSPIVVYGDIALVTAAVQCCTVTIAPEMVLGSVLIAVAEATASSAALSPDVLLGSLSFTVIVAASSSALQADIILGSVAVEPQPISASTSSLSELILGSITLDISSVNSGTSTTISDTVLGPIVIESVAIASVVSIAPELFWGSTLVDNPIASTSTATIDPEIPMGSVWVTPSPVIVASISLDPTVYAGNQFARPISDYANDVWENELGQITNLYESINENLADNNDYIVAPLSNSHYTCSLGPIDDPDVHVLHKLRFRYKKVGTSPSRQLSVVLLCDTTPIASWNTSVSGDYEDVELDLTETQAGNISDYSLLRVQFVAEEVV